MLSSWKSLTCVCTIARPYLNGAANLLNQQVRPATTVILKRKYPIRLNKKNHTPRKLNHRDFIYEIQEYTQYRKKKPLEIILTQYVEGYGEKGEKVTLKANFAYNNFILPKLAVYASPENMEKYYLEKANQQKTYSSITAALTMKLLQRYLLPVNMSIENPWVIENWHIKANFRKIGVIVPEDAIKLPDKEIRGPNLDLEGKEFYVTVTINKTEQVNIRCRLLHDCADVSKQLPYEPDRWKIPGEAIFPEDQEFLDSLPKPNYDQMEKGMPTVT